MILAIYCAGGLGREIIEFARSINRWENIIFVDDVTGEKNVSGADVFRFSQVEQFRGDLEFVIANGEPAVREILYNKVKNAGYPLGTLISPYCSILSKTEIGEGCILYDCVISTNVHIGPNVLMNEKVLVGHDTVIGEHSVLSALNFLGGDTYIGKRVYIAPGAMIKDRIRIGDDAIISLGAVILRNVRASSIMVGNPARKLGNNVEKTVFHRFL